MTLIIMEQPCTCLIPPKFLKCLHGLSLTFLRLANLQTLKQRDSNSAGHQVYSLPTCSNNGWQVNNQHSSVLFKKDETQKLQVKLKNVTTVNTSIFFFFNSL